MREENENTGVIYCIVNKLNAKRYVGQALSYIMVKNKIKKHGIEGRFAVHIKSANKFSESCPKLYNAMRKNGTANFSISVIEVCNKTELLEKETMWIKILDTANYGYNIVTNFVGTKKYSNQEYDERRISRKDKISISMKEKWKESEYSIKTQEKNLIAAKNRAASGKSRKNNVDLPPNIYETTDGYDIRIMRNNKYKITSVTSTTKSKELLLAEAISKRDELEKRMENDENIFEQKTHDHKGNNLPKCISYFDAKQGKGYKLVIRRQNKRIDRMFIDPHLSMNDKLTKALEMKTMLMENFDTEYEKIQQHKNNISDKHKDHNDNLLPENITQYVARDSPGYRARLTNKNGKIIEKRISGNDKTMDKKLELIKEWIKVNKP